MIPPTKEEIKRVTDHLKQVKISEYIEELEQLAHNNSPILYKDEIVDPDVYSKKALIGLLYLMYESYKSGNGMYPVYKDDQPAES